ncbi:MAG: glycoside hydrolase family 6 protein [Actinobacteria bacterium]|nr:glycoside hydrolase family 6 protein [Actinomycetota bacterium]
MSLPRTLTALVGCALVFAGCAQGLADPPPQRLFVDSQSNAAKAARALETAGRKADALAIRAIADQPVGVWAGGWLKDVRSYVRGVIDASRAEGSLPVFVAYNIPNRDCGSYSAGGAASEGAYAAWIEAFATGLDGGPAAVVLEPDAVPQTLVGCLPAAVAARRPTLLRAAITSLKRQPGVRVYLDAGNAGWIRDPAILAGALREAGVGQADGFSLNVANFYSTDVSVAFGRRLSALLGGVPFVIDTGRNGRGPAPVGISGPKWCNPPGRGLGDRPTLQTGMRGVDALLWIKPPGNSDGNCRPGEPRAGEWWDAYARALIRNAEPPIQGG